MTESGLRLAVLADANHVNCQRWCEGLSDAGSDVHLLSFHVGDVERDRTYRLPQPRLATKLQYVTSVRCVRQLLNQIRPDVVIAYYATGYGTLGALAGYHPLVLVTSGSDVLLAPQNPLMRRLLRFNISRADLVTSWAPHMAQAARELGAVEDRLMVFPRGIPSDRFTSRRCKAPTESDPVHLITTRSLKLDYNTAQLLLACSLLREKRERFSLTVAGSGPEREHLVHQSRKLELEGHVHFSGFVCNDDLPALLAKHNLYISLVESDGVSASLLEAMAVGLLPIVPDHPGNRHWISSGENGLLLGDLSPDAIAQAILAARMNLPLRERALRQNPEIVSSRADLYKNANVFLRRFRELAQFHAKSNADHLRLPNR